jgi:hypothetical protein
MTKVQRELIKNAVGIYLATHKMETLVKRAQVGTKAIKAVMDGDTRYITEDVWLSLEEAVCEEITAGLYRTADCLKMITAFDHARAHQLMVGITGDTGMGKSFVSRLIAQRDNTYLHSLDLSMTPRTFMEALLLDLKCSIDGNLNALVRRASEVLNKKNCPLLIIDEASRMSHKMMEVIKELRDKTDQNLGIALVGMPNFKNSFIRAIENGKPGYSEFYRRINLWDGLQGLQAGEVEMVLTHNGITDIELQKEFRRHKKFGDLVNEIRLFKVLNAA